MFCSFLALKRHNWASEHVHEVTCEQLFLCGWWWIPILGCFSLGILWNEILARSGKAHCSFPRNILGVRVYLQSKEKTSKHSVFQVAINSQASQGDTVNCEHYTWVHTQDVCLQFLCKVEIQWRYNNELLHEISGVHRLFCLCWINTHTMYFKPKCSLKELLSKEIPAQCFFQKLPCLCQELTIVKRESVPKVFSRLVWQWNILAFASRPKLPGSHSAYFYNVPTLKIHIWDNRKF